MATKCLKGHMAPKVPDTSMAPKGKRDPQSELKGRPPREPKASPKGASGSERAPKGSQTGAEGSQQRAKASRSKAKRNPTSQKNKSHDQNSFLPKTYPKTKSYLKYASILHFFFKWEGSEISKIPSWGQKADS